MERFLKNNEVTIRLNTTVKNIKIVDGAVEGVETNNGFIECDSVVVATGGFGTNKEMIKEEFNLNLWEDFFPYDRFYRRWI